jgi:hypothetical protein
LRSMAARAQDVTSTPYSFTQFDSQRWLSRATPHV